MNLFLVHWTKLQKVMLVLERGLLLARQPRLHNRVKESARDGPFLWRSAGLRNVNHGGGGNLPKNQNLRLPGRLLYR
jgi:hypothetical protein